MPQLNVKSKKIYNQIIGWREREIGREGGREGGRGVITYWPATATYKAPLLVTWLAHPSDERSQSIKFS